MLMVEKLTCRKIRVLLKKTNKAYELEQKDLNWRLGDGLWVQVECLKKQLAI